MGEEHEGMGIKKMEVKQQSNSGTIKIGTNDKHYYKHDDFSIQNYKDIFDNLKILLWNEVNVQGILILKISNVISPAPSEKSLPLIVKQSQVSNLMYVLPFSSKEFRKMACAVPSKAINSALSFLLFCYSPVQRLVGRVHDTTACIRLKC